MKVIETELKGVKLIKPPTIYEDFRLLCGDIQQGHIFQEWNKSRFIQDDILYSRHNVLRGIHGDRETWKLISCLRENFIS